jgi:galactonate dehydratase
MEVVDDEVKTMKIREVKTHLINIASRNLLLVCIDTDEGISGVGECTATYGAGSLAVEGAVKEFASFLMGQDPSTIELLCETIRFKSFWGMSGGPYVCSAIAGIEQALWDIKGKALNTPVYELLGGRVRDTVRVYANTWSTVHWQKTEDYVKFALKAVEDGFSALKIYPFGVGKILQNDRAIVDRVDAARDAIGDEVDLMVDGGWRYSSDTSTAIRIGKKLERFNLRFYEEPINPGDVDAMAKVASNVNIPIAAGERIYTLNGFKDYLDKQALDIIQPDVGLAQGILELKKIAALAETYHVQVAPHNCSGPVATAATLQLAASIPNLFMLELFPYEHAWHEMVDEPLEKQIKNGYLEVPRKPGLGIRLKIERLKQYQVKSSIIS